MIEKWAVAGNVHADATAIAVLDCVSGTSFRCVITVFLEWGVGGAKNIL
jgi:hypothetical protein